MGSGKSKIASENKSNVLNSKSFFSNQFINSSIAVDISYTFIIFGLSLVFCVLLRKLHKKLKEADNMMNMMVFRDHCSEHDGHQSV